MLELFLEFLAILWEWIVRGFGWGMSIAAAALTAFAVVCMIIAGAAAAFYLLVAVAGCCAGIAMGALWLVDDFPDWLRGQAAAFRRWRTGGG